MHPQIIKVDDIHQSIMDVGLEYFTDRLIQNANGEYFYVTHEKIDYEDVRKHKHVAIYSSEKRNSQIQIAFKYNVDLLPLPVAWFIIDALKLQQQVLGIGTGEYKGPHGGRISVFIPPNTEFKCEKSDKPTEIPAKLGRIIVEDL